MRSRFFLIAALLMTPTSVFAQPPEAAEVSQELTVEAPAGQRPSASQAYLVKLVEFRFSEAPSASLTAEDILGRLRQSAEDNGVEVVQTFHLSAMAGHESRAEVDLRTVPDVLGCDPVGAARLCPLRSQRG